MKKTLAKMWILIELFLISALVWFVQLNIQHGTEFRTNEAGFFATAAILFGSMGVCFDFSELFQEHTK